MTTEDDRSLAADGLGDIVGTYLRRSQTQTRLRVRATCEMPQRFDTAAWREFATIGLQAAVVPAEAGGLGASLGDIAAICQELGAHLVPEPFVGAALAPARLLRALPAGAVRDDLLHRLRDGELIAGVAWQETPGELAPGRCQARLTPTPAGEVLAGRKAFVVPGTGAHGWLTLAWRGDTPVVVWVPADAHGVTVSDLARVDATAMADIAFHDVALPPAHVLGQGDEALQAVREAIDVARLGAAAELVGVMRRALEITLEYMRTRVQFDKPIGSFQALQHRAVDAQLAFELARAALEDAAARTEDNPASLPREASRAKARASASALEVTRFAVQVHGAMGVTDECDIGLYFKRALGLNAWLGGPGPLRARYRAHLETSATSRQDEIWDEPEFPREADWEAMPEPRFRAMVRAFTRAHCPPQIMNLPRTVSWREYKPWFMALSRQGWVAPAWPREFGGMGLSPAKLLAFNEELENLGAPRSADFGITMIGPLLIRHGTPAQQAQLIPAILRGEIVWSQGYSEPGAGSDLAGLRTQAVLEGDTFIVNGQKIWNGHANSATHMFMLVRTAKGARKQEGISFLLVDLQTPGVTVRGIRDINGEEKLCEVFFDNVRVPKENLVGEMNQGWALAKSLLGFERLYLGSPKQAQNALARLLAVSDKLGLEQDPVFAARLVECLLDVRDAAALYGSYAAIFKAGRPIPAGVGMLKVAATQTYQRVCYLLAEAVQEHGAIRGASAGTGEVDVVSMLLTSVPSSIYGGSNEIQRNIVAKAVLNLPG